MLKGVCHFFSETGTEGGHWAFQDERFIQKNVMRPFCAKCGVVLAITESGPLKAVKILPLTDELLLGIEPQECPDGKHVQDVGDSWSYEGLHVLEDGDLLTIFNPEDSSQVVWTGVIALKHHALFTEHASGLWIHSDQDGIDRKTWAEYFLKEYPAELIPSRKT